MLKAAPDLNQTCLCLSQTLPVQQDFNYNGLESQQVALYSWATGGGAWSDGFVSLLGLPVIQPPNGPNDPLARLNPRTFRAVRRELRSGLRMARQGRRIRV